MRTKRTSAKRSSPSKKISKPKTTPLGQSILRGLEQGAAWARGDIQLRTRQIYVFDDIDVKTVRQKSGLSQVEFADRYGFNPRTLQDWEQGRAKPEMAVLAYLKVIEKIPEGVEAALRS